jgi:hypothetical protein
MADPQTAAANPLRNIEVKTGKSFAELCLLIQTSGPSKVGEQRQMLMQQLGLGYGDANRLAIRAKDATAPKSADANPLDTLYSGNKAALHPLHDQLNAAIDALGPHEKAPKKSYVSYRRNKQFATLGPATQSAIELGLNAKDLPPSARLKALPPGGMCRYSVRLSAPAEVAAELLAWVAAAYVAAT